MNLDLPNVSIHMVRPTLADVPKAPLPAPYSSRYYRPGDEATWVRIHNLADGLSVATRNMFEDQFGHDEQELRKRQLYLCDGEGDAIATVTAWHNVDYAGRPYGRVHWVAVVPAHQGRGLGKPLLAACLRRMVELGCKGAYLTTAPPRIPAINLYLRFGFRPVVRSEREREAWRLVSGCVKEELRKIVAEAVDHPA